jgi:hypothetical protein
MDCELSGRNAEALETAFRELAADRPDSAIDTLADRFTSVCERQRPGLGDVEHPSACHLHEDATAWLDERLAADDGSASDSGAEADATAD